MNDQLSDPASGNADQIAYWNAAAGERWAALQSRIDAAFGPLTEATLAYAAPERGSKVLDVGCGAGATVLALADLVGDAGAVLGVDVSKPMLAVAAQRVEAAGLANARLLLADAATHRFDSDRFTLAFSRFGVMFFDDPAAAFANIRTGLAEEGRLAFACWQPLAANPWFAVPVGAMQALLPPAPPSDPLAPGPFAFADPVRVEDVLTRAGFKDIAITPHETGVRLGSIEAAVDLLSQVGPASRALADAALDLRPALIAALRGVLVGHDGPDGVVLGGAIWLVSARA